MKSLLEKTKQLVELKKATISEQEKRAIRKGFKRFDEGGHDPLAHQKTITPGVSDIGIQTRRADAKVPGAIAHGYGRVSDPAKHAEHAKKAHQQLLSHLKSMAKPSLPKVEKKQRIEPAIVSPPITNVSPMVVSSPQYVNSPLYVQGKDSKK